MANLSCSGSLRARAWAADLTIIVLAPTIDGAVVVQTASVAPTRNDVYEVTGAGPLRTRLQVSARRGLSRFVGRHVELEQMQQALAQVKEGHGQIMGLIGEPGLGKSRLFYEFKLPTANMGHKETWYSSDLMRPVNRQRIYRFSVTQISRCRVDIRKPQHDPDGLHVSSFV